MLYNLATPMAAPHSRPEAVLRDALQRDGGRISRWSNPAIAPRPLAVGGMVEQKRSGGRDVAPLGADVRVSRDTWKVSGIQSPKSLCDFRGPRTMPVGLHGPGAVYPAHEHAYRKILVVAEGSITFSVSGGRRVVAMRPGDRLDLPPGTPHSAVVGPDGVVCLEAHLEESA